MAPTKTNTPTTERNNIRRTLQNWGPLQPTVYRLSSDDIRQHESSRSLIHSSRDNIFQKPAEQSVSWRPSITVPTRSNRVTVQAEPSPNSLYCPDMAAMLYDSEGENSNQISHELNNTGASSQQADLTNSPNLASDSLECREQVTPRPAIIRRTPVPITEREEKVRQFRLDMESFGVKIELLQRSSNEDAVASSLPSASSVYSTGSCSPPCFFAPDEQQIQNYLSAKHIAPLPFQGHSETSSSLSTESQGDEVTGKETCYFVDADSLLARHLPTLEQDDSEWAQIPFTAERKVSEACPFLSSSSFTGQLDRVEAWLGDTRPWTPESVERQVHESIASDDSSNFEHCPRPIPGNQLTSNDGRRRGLHEDHGILKTYRWSQSIANTSAPHSVSRCSVRETSSYRSSLSTAEGHQPASVDCVLCELGQGLCSLHAEYTRPPYSAKHTASPPDTPYLRSVPDKKPMPHLADLPYSNRPVDPELYAAYSLPRYFSRPAPRPQHRRIQSSGHYISVHGLISENSGRPHQSPAPSPEFRPVPLLPKPPPPPPPKDESRDKQIPGSEEAARGLRDSVADDFFASLEAQNMVHSELGKKRGSGELRVWMRRMKAAKGLWQRSKKDDA